MCDAASILEMLTTLTCLENPFDRGYPIFRFQSTGTQKPQFSANTCIEIIWNARTALSTHGRRYTEFNKTISFFKVWSSEHHHEYRTYLQPAYERLILIFSAARKKVIINTNIQYQFCSWTAAFCYVYGIPFAERIKDYLPFNLAILLLQPLFNNRADFLLHYRGSGMSGLWCGIQFPASFFFSYPDFTYPSRTYIVWPQPSLHIFLSYQFRNHFLPLYVQNRFTWGRKRCSFQLWALSSL